MAELGFREFELRHGAGTYQKRNIQIVRGEGCRVYDAQGRSYLDAIAGIGAALLGHNHPRLVEAISNQASTLISAPELVCNPVRAAYQRRLTATMPAGFERVFLCNSGAESIEGALKFARLATARPGVIALKRGYHGKTLGALSATFEPGYREPFHPLLEGFRHVPVGDMEALRTALEAEPAVGAFLFEAVQGESGVRPVDPAYLAAAAEMARNSGAMVIADEVQCGMGRTGRIWGFEAAGIEPDLICASKGIAGGVPLGAIGIGPRIPELPALSHTSTFGGNPLACAAGLAVLDALEADDLIAQAARQGERLMQAVRGTDLKVVREVRGAGLMIGIELKVHAGPFLEPLAEAGLLVLLAGQRVIRLLPPLTLADEDTDEMARILNEVLRR